VDIVRPLIDLKVDQEKCFISIYCYHLSIILTGIGIVVAIGAMHVNCTIHACSLFSVIG